MPGNDNGKHRFLSALVCVLHRIQQCGRKALGLRAGVLDRDHLCQNGKRDLLCRLGANGQTDGGTECFHTRRIHALLQQLTAHQCGTAFAAHHAHIGGRFAQDLFQAHHIKGVSTGHHHKIGLRSAGHLLQRRFEGLAEHGVCARCPQLTGIFFAVIHCQHRQTQQLCQTDYSRGYMTAAADDKLRHGTKALHKDPLPADLLHTGRRAALQRRQISAKEFRLAALPHRHTLT